jgi:hypothetical protein
MSNPYLPPPQAGQPNPAVKRFQPPTRAEDYQPAGNQFTLRGMFIFMTATCVILAILALVLKEPMDWLGAMLVPVICLVVIGVMELCRLLFPPKPHFNYYLPPLPQNPMQTAYFGEGENPFAGGENYFGDKGGNSPFCPPTPPSFPSEQAPREKTG